MTAVLKRELRSYFTSPIAYVFIGILCALYGFQYWIVMLNGSSYYITSYVYQNMFMWSLMLLPIITMRSMCEDRKNKTDQALLTAPVSVDGHCLGQIPGLPYGLPDCHAAVPGAGSSHRHFFLAELGVHIRHLCGHHPLRRGDALHRRVHLFHDGEPGGFRDCHVHCQRADADD